VKVLTAVLSKATNASCSTVSSAHFAQDSEILRDALAPFSLIKVHVFTC
jgi:hypothetical protein